MPVTHSQRPGLLSKVVLRINIGRTETVHRLLPDGGLADLNHLRKEICGVRSGSTRRSYVERLESFEDVWKAMNLDKQRTLLRQLVEKVGYGGRTGKVTVSLKSASVKDVVNKEAVR